MSNQIIHNNRLSKEKSPYLLQHAHNPVDWFPWGREAFANAIKDDKPVFLSVGYSTCHWCHVMERESFEDEGVARLLNDAFICIKVDREERPDIDNMFMAVCTALTGTGGWPLTIIMTPDKKPFFAATYIPRESKWGRTGLIDLVPKIKELWAINRKDIDRSADEIKNVLNSEIKEKTKRPGWEIFDNAFSDFAASYDTVSGGFGSSPKFPSAHNLIFLMRYWHSSKNKSALQMASETLKRMRLGGIFDQNGFGFHRYSTDSGWLVPHFEKMLYDQAMLAIAYAEAYQATKDDFYKSVCTEILTYVLRDMTSPEGAFYSAEDADSEGIEGKFYLWTRKELAEILTDEEVKTAVSIFNIKQDGNFTEEYGQKNAGRNILYLKDTLDRTSIAENIQASELKDIIEKIRKKLFAARERRVHPFKDDKILTDWNGIMIAAFAFGGRILNNRDYINIAVKASEFIKKNFWTGDNRLLHRYREGEAAVVANIDDYAFLSWGLLELYEVTLSAEYLKYASDLAEVMITHFADEKTGAFYFSPDDIEDSISRRIILYDGAIPSGNSVAFYSLVRLAGMTGNFRFEEQVKKITDHVPYDVIKIPSGHAMFLTALTMALGEAREIVISGKAGDPLVNQMISVINKSYLPDTTMVYNPSEIPDIDIAQSIKLQVPVDGKATAYVCRGNTCGSPVTDINELIKVLGVES